MLISEGIRYTINSGGNIVYRIAICDDEINICTGLEEMLQKIMQEFNVQFEIEPWFSGERLCQDLDAGNRYELIFLDIQMLTLNGIDVGKLIRNDLNDFKTQIVYISYHKDYAIHLFKTQPLDFLVKPLAYDAVKDVIRTFLKLEEKKKVFLSTILEIITINSHVMIFYTYKVMTKNPNDSISGKERILWQVKDNNVATAV